MLRSKRKNHAEKPLPLDLASTSCRSSKLQNSMSEAAGQIVAILVKLGIAGDAFG